jgi:uncharacterized phage-associated protein
MCNGKIDISALDVAKYFLYKANKDGDLVTNLKMQKLLYYAQAWHLVNFDGQPLFRETIRAWAFGPVVKEVYDKYKKFGASPIKHTSTEKEAAIFSKEQIKYLDDFYDVFFKFSAHELVNMTHNEAPWKEAYKGNGNISRQSMKQFYSRMLHANNGKK